MCSKKNLLICLFTFLLTSCGGGDSDTQNNGEVTPPLATLTGVFIDRPVEGLQYETETQSGITNQQGEYLYLPGEIVTFFIGGIVLGSSKAGPVVTPLSLVGGAINASDPGVSNRVRFLLSLDSDKNPANGVSIASSVRTAASGLTVNFNATDLELDEGISRLLALLPTVTLVDASTAQAHFSQTLAGLSNWGSFKWGSGTWRSASQ